MQTKKNLFVEGLKRTRGQKRGGKEGESVERSLNILAFTLIVSNQES